MNFIIFLRKELFVIIKCDDKKRRALTVVCFFVIKKYRSSNYIVVDIIADLASEVD